MRPAPLHLDDISRKPPAAALWPLALARSLRLARAAYRAASAARRAGGILVPELDVARPRRARVARHRGGAHLGVPGLLSAGPPGS